MFRPIIAIVSVALTLALSAAASAQTSIAVRTYPVQPLIEWDGHGQYLNFDFGFENPGDSARVLERIELTVLDPAGRMVWQQFVWSKGAANPALKGVDLNLPAQGKLGLFNPFHDLPPSLPLGTLRYRFIFAMEGLDPTVVVTHEVKPIRYGYPVVMTPPVDGPALVYDGHEFYSHHRRIPLGSPAMGGLPANPVRYANDFTPVGPRGELSRGPLADPTQWYGYGAVVRAPADGEVVAAASDVPDNRIERGELKLPDGFGKLDELRQALGNHVVIKHAGGLYSTLAHLRPGTVRLAVGARVRAGQEVGQIGFSGDTGFHVHVHHMVAGEFKFITEGLPVRFDGVRRIGLPRSGAAQGPAQAGVRLDTGDLFEVVRRGR